MVVTGDEILDTKLRGLPLRVQKKLSRQATRRGAKMILNKAKQEVPVQRGALENSLVVRAMKRSRTRFGHQVVTRDGAFKGDTFYGSFIDLGTKERVQKTTGRRTGKIDAQEWRFLRPAVYDQSEALKRLYVVDMHELIRELERRQR